MSKDRPDSGGLLGSILASLFDKIEDEDALALVGILFENRIVLSREYLSLFRQRPKGVTLEPLEPQAASMLVADLFQKDCDALFRSFHREWAKLRQSPRVHALQARITSHRYVERLEPWTALP